MRVGVDANLSYRVVDALNAIFGDAKNPKAPTFEQVGVGRADSDAPWIADFANEGGRAILGVDKRIIARPHEVQALREASLSACFFDFGKKGARLNFQSGSILNLWPRIEAIWTSSRKPIILRAKVSANLDWQRLEQLDYEMDDGVPRVRHIAFRED